MTANNRLTRRAGSNDSPTPTGSEGAAPSSAKFWDKRSKHYDDAVQKHGAIYQKTIEETASLLRKTDVVLDLGCATGEIALDIAPHVQRVHGIDISKNMIDLANKKARERQIDNVSFCRTDAFDPRLTGQSLSAIMAFSVFHLLEDAPKTLDRLHDLLAPGGLLISETPCLAERNWVIRSLIKFAVAVGFAPMIRDFTFADLESLVSSGHFQILESKIWDEKSRVLWILAKKV